jgi:hypothetical protein
LTCQWYYSNLSGNAAISGATTTSYLLSGVTTNSAGTYSVVVSNGGNSVTSSPYAGILSVRTPVWLTTSTGYAHYTNNLNYANTNNGYTNWYLANSSALYTAVLTSSIPHIVHYDAGTFQTTGEEDWNYNTAQAGWQHWGNIGTNGPDTIIQLVCNSNYSMFNYIFGSAEHDPGPTPIRTDGFQLHDLTLDCNGNYQMQRNYSNNTNLWGGVFTSGNNIVISNVTFIHFGKQDGIEEFPLLMNPAEGLDENSHLITLYSNITVENCVFTTPAVSNGLGGGLTTAAMLPGWGKSPGDDGIVFGLTNTVILNCTITNINTFFGWTNGFSAVAIQNCFVNGCGSAVYFEIGNPVYYGQSSLIQGNYFTNVNYGLYISYNEVSQYPMAVGSITMLSNVIALAPPPANYSFDAGVLMGVANNEAPIPQIPTLTAQYNQITGTGPDSRWGFYLWNTSNALVTGNSVDNASYGLMEFDANFTRQPIDTYIQRMPLSYLAANHNTDGSQLIPITPWGSTPTVPPIGTQQKGDFNLDGYTDLLWRNTNTGQNVLWPMNGTNTISCGSAVLSNGVPSMPAGWMISGTADFTGDCNDDILWTMPGTTNVLLWTMMGPSFVCSNWMRALSNNVLHPFGIAGGGDFNGDGKTDLVITNSSSTQIRLMNGTNWMQDITIPNSGPSTHAQIVGVGPFLGGEQADILWRDYTTGSNFVWVMQGTNYFATTNIASQTDTNWQVQGVGDFNGDGIADILWRHAVTGSNAIWLTSVPLGGYTNVVLPQLTNLIWTIAGPK